MKYTFSLLTIILLLLISCGKNENKDQFIPDFNNPAPSSVSTEAIPAEQAITQKSDENKPEGLKLIETADCLACHKVDAKLIGPSYQEVAKKYTDADLDILANKIIEGGKGNWGDVPMTPHPTITKEDAKTMVKYILSLKK